MKTAFVWKEETSPPVKNPCVLEVEHDNETGDVEISFLNRDCEETRLHLDEHAWHALYEMMGEVKP